MNAFTFHRFLSFIIYFCNSTAAADVSLSIARNVYYYFWWSYLSCVYSTSVVNMVTSNNAGASVM